MNVRRARSSDDAAVREVAHRSLEASYTLSPQTIEGAVTQWYDTDEFDAKLSDDSVLFLVAVDDDEVVGFSEAQVVEGGAGDVLWLHVSPDYRGEGIGEALFDATRERLAERGTTSLRGRVLRDNPTGNEFYEAQGFTRVGEGTVTIDGTDHVENVYAAEQGEVETLLDEDGAEVYLDREDRDRGSVAPFVAVYSDPGRTRRYGFYCTNCENLANAMDAMGRIECPACGNQRKPTRWDAGYL